jgi:small conductance mechanosensitive channel
LSKVPNVLATPLPDVDVLQFTPAGPLLVVRPYCQNQHYWQVYFDSTRLIREAFGQAGFPAPAPEYVVSGPPRGALAGPAAGLSS